MPELSPGNGSHGNPLGRKPPPPSVRACPPNKGPRTPHDGTTTPCMRCSPALLQVQRYPSRHPQAPDLKDIPGERSTALLSWCPSGGKLNATTPALPTPRSLFQGASRRCDVVVVVSDTRTPHLPGRPRLALATTPVIATNDWRSATVIMTPATMPSKEACTPTKLNDTPGRESTCSQEPANNMAAREDERMRTCACVISAWRCAHRRV